jgi:hypothetical protein
LLNLRRSLLHTPRFADLATASEYEHFLEEFVAAL